MADSQRAEFGGPLGGAHAGYPCAKCGKPGADYFVPPSPPAHRACLGLVPDVLSWPWLLVAYSIVVPFGCTFIGALLASLPYYVWKGAYPQSAKIYNMHVWIAFAISCCLWLGLFALSTLVMNN